MSASAYLTSVLGDSPTAIWECQDTSGNPQDSSGNVHHMTSTTGSVSYKEPGPFGTDFSIRFGTNGLTSQTFFDNTMNNMSCEVWVQVVSAPTGVNADLFSNAQDNGSGGGIRGWSFDVATDLKFQVVVQGIVVESKSSNALPSPSGGSNRFLSILGVGGGIGVARWSMVNCVRDAGTWKYYFNGVLDGTHGTDTPNVLTAGPPAGLCAFGGSNWDGRYAYVSYWATALTATKIANHYAAALV